MLVKQGYRLYFYRNEKSTVEMDFFVRDKSSLIPVEVKANDGAKPSLNNLISKPQYGDIKYGVKLSYRNIGFNGSFYTLPYFLTFLLKWWLAEKLGASGDYVFHPHKKKVKYLLDRYKRSNFAAESSKLGCTRRKSTLSCPRLR